MTTLIRTVKHVMTEQEKEILERNLRHQAQESRQSVRGFGLLMLIILSVTALAFAGAVANGYITL